MSIVEEARVVDGERQVGRAEIVRHVGRARLDADGPKRVPPAARTAAMPAPTPPPPVFVDDSGRRRRRIRGTLLLAAAVIALVVGTVWALLSGPSARPAPVVTCKPHAAACR